jgi:hypothetical protein
VPYSQLLGLRPSGGRHCRSYLAVEKGIRARLLQACLTDCGRGIQGENEAAGDKAVAVNKSELVDIKEKRTGCIA